MKTLKLWVLLALMALVGLPAQAQDISRGGSSSASISTSFAAPLFVNGAQAANGNVTTTTCTGTPGSGTGCVTLQVTGLASAGITVSGTFTGTLQFFGSGDGGTTYTALNATPLNSSSQVTSTTGIGNWTAAVGGLTHLKVVASALGSGTAVVSINAALAGGSSGGGGGGGGNAAAGATGSAVPASADYLGLNSAGNLVGVSIGQQTAANSIPVILPSATITTLTPPAAISGFSTSTKQSDGTQKTQIVDGSGAVIASTSNNLNVQCANCSGSGASAADNATVTESTSTFAPVGGEFLTSPGTVTTGHQSMVAITAHRAFQVSFFDAAGNAMLGSKTSANSLPVVIASDQGTVAVSLASVPSHAVTNAGTFATQDTQAGTWTVQPGNTANTTAWLVTGSKTHNNAAPAATNFGSLDFLANASAPTFTEGDQVLGSVDLHGSTRVTLLSSSGTAITPSTDATTNTASQSTGPQLFANGSSATPSAVGADGRSIAVWADTVGRLHTICDSGCGGSGGTSAADEATFTQGTTSLTPFGGLFKTSYTALTSGQVGVAQMTSNGGLFTNLDKVQGTAVDVNSGTKSAGTIRVVLATDQPALTNKLLVTPDSVALPANQSVNVSQINGVTTTMDNGVSGSGVQRVTIASNSTGTLAVTQATAANLNVRDDTSGATGAAPPARAQYVAYLGSGATGGLLTGVAVGDTSKVINISTATTTLMITGVSGRQVHITAFHLLNNAADNIAWVEGTGATCGTGTAGMAGGTTAATGYVLIANQGLAMGTGVGEVLTTATTGDSVCLITSAATQVSGHIRYSIY